MEPTLTKQEHTSTKLGSSEFTGKRWVAISLVILCVLVSWVGVIDHKTKKYVDGAILQALAAYAGARTLNAGISLLQSGEVGGRFLVADASIHPFETLDPLNDMVEDYASVMKYAIGSLMIQKLLVETLSTNTFKWLITVAAALLLASLLLFNGLYATTLLKSFFFITLVRFLFVITILISGMVDSTFVNKKTETELNKVKIATVEVAQFEGGNSDITSSERESINTQVQVLETKRDELNARIKVKSEEVASAKIQLDNEKEGVKDAGKEMALWKKGLNNLPFGRLGKDENYSEAKEEMKEAKAYVKEQEKVLKDLEQQLEEVQESLADQHKQLVGETGLFENAKDKITKLKGLSFGRIKSAITDSIESMLQLIALFVFKTLLMPLAFLLLFLRAFKLIWGIDPRSLLKDSYSEIKRG